MQVARGARLTRSLGPGGHIVHEGVREGRPLAGTFVGREVGTVGSEVRGAADADDDLLECVPKVPRKERVDDGIYRRVAVAQPEQNREDDVGRAAVAKGAQQVHGKEGQPAHDESAHNNGQCLGRFRLHPEAFRL